MEQRGPVCAVSRDSRIDYGEGFWLICLSKKIVLEASKISSRASSGW